MAFVHEHERVVRDVFEQGRRRLAGLAAREPARIVLDAGADARRHQHFEIEHRALLEPLGFEQAPGPVQLDQALLHFLADAFDRLVERRARRDVVRVCVDLDALEFVVLRAGERIEFVDRLHVVAEQRNAPGAVFIVCGEEFDHVAAHAEGAAREIHVGAAILERDEVRDQLALVELRALGDVEGHARIGFDRADAVDAGDGGDDDDVVALEQCAGRRVAHAVDLLVDRGIFFDVGVRARDIGFRLVVVVIRDEVLDRVVGEEILELAIELRRQRLVRRENERGALRALDHLRHRKGLAGAGDAQEHLRALVVVHAFDQFLDRGGLVAGGLERRDQLEFPAAFGFRGAFGAMRHPERVVDLGAAVFDEIRKRVGGSLHAHRGNVVGVVLRLLESGCARKLRIDRGRENGRIERKLRAFGHAMAHATGGSIGLIGLSGLRARGGLRLFRHGPNMGNRTRRGKGGGLARFAEFRPAGTARPRPRRDSRSAEAHRHSAG